jgi:hypothetical protein
MSVVTLSSVGVGGMIMAVGGIDVNVAAAGTGVDLEVGICTSAVMTAVDSADGPHPVITRHMTTNMVKKKCLVSMIISLPISVFVQNYIG